MLIPDLKKVQTPDPAFGGAGWLGWRHVAATLSRLCLRQKVFSLIFWVGDLPLRNLEFVDLVGLGIDHVHAAGDAGIEGMDGP